LPPSTTSRIATGKVIERLASVVKELVENTINASSSYIEVRIKKGGKELIEVIDNGCGMTEEDAVMMVAGVLKGVDKTYKERYNCKD
jgi:DNA mismatch repair protein MutL